MGELEGLARGGVLLTAQARAAGWPARRLNRRLRTEGWTRIINGAWCAPGRAVDEGVRLLALQLTGPERVASHRSAAAVHGIELLRTEVELTAPRGVNRPASVRVHHLPLHPHEVVTVRGLRVTTVVRTLGDLLRAGPRDEALVAVDSALTWRTVRGRRVPPLTDEGRLAVELRGSRAGTARGREWLGLADARCGSPAETIARLRMHDGGLHPQSQVELRTPSGRLCRPDFFFRREGVVVEIEGYAFHGTRDAHRRDIQRFNDLAACPEVRVILRFTALQVFHQPESMLAAIRQQLA
ncbi:hypothetical protein [Streptomyces altiplanensis]